MSAVGRRWRPRARALLRLAWRDVRRDPGRSAMVLLLVIIAALLTCTAAVAGARAIAPDSTLALGTQGDANVTGILDPHVLTFLWVVAALGAVETVLLVVPAFLVSAHRRLRECGLVAAAGGRESDMAAMVLVPAGLLGAVGSALGCVLGFALGTAITPAPGTPSPAQVTWPLVAAVAVALAITGLALLAAGYPAVVVARTPLVDALAARVATPRRRPRTAALLGGALVLGVAGGWLAADGAARASGAAVVLGVVGSGVAVGLLLVAALRGLRLVHVRRWFTATFALRDAARHPVRLLPGVGASAGGIAAVVAAMVFVGSTHASELAEYVPTAPVGSAFVSFAPDSAPPDEQALDAALASVATPSSQVRVRAATSADGFGYLAVGSPGYALANTGSLLEQMGPPIGDDAFVDAYGMDDDVAVALADGALVVASDLGDLVGVDGTVEVTTNVGDVTTVQARALLPPGSPSDVLLPEDLALELGFEMREVGAILQADRPLTAEDADGLAAATAQAYPAGWVSVETGPPALQSRDTQYALIAAAVAAVVGISWLVSVQSAAESRADQATLEAVGAPPGLRRRVVGLQSGLMSVAAVVAGVPLGLALGMLLLQVRQNQPGYDMRELVVDVPWAPVAALAAALPLLVALGSALVAPRAPVLTHRAAD